MRKGFHATSHEFIVENDAHRREMIGFLASLKIIPGRSPWRITIEPDTNPMTHKQRKRMWSAFRFIAANVWVVVDKDTGETKQFPAEAWHDYYCGKFIGWLDIPGGTRTAIGTSTLNTREHNVFMDRVIADAIDEHHVDWTQWEEKTA